MRSVRPSVWVCCLSCAGNNKIKAVDAVTGTISTVVGTGTGGFDGDGGWAANALLNVPVHVTFDNTSNMFISDFSNRRIRRVDTHTGIITTVVGLGTPGFSGDNGPASAAELNNPASVAFHPRTQAMFIADSLNHVIRTVDPATGIISTYAGTGKYGFSGDNGPSTSARLWSPMSIAFDHNADLLISDTYNQRVRRVNAATGIITTIAGTGAAGFGGDNAAATDAQMSTPEGLAVSDRGGSVYVADYQNHRMRELIPVAEQVTL